MLKSDETPSMVYDFLLFQMIIPLHARVSWISIIAKVYPKEKPLPKLIDYANDWIRILTSAKEKHVDRWHLEQQVLFYISWNITHMQLQTLNLHAQIVKFEHRIHMNWSVVKCEKEKFLSLASRCMKSESPKSYLAKLLARAVAMIEQSNQKPL
jgi:hypothetical protein